MTDVGSHHFVKSSDRVLVPQPSDDPHDPLVSPPLFENYQYDLKALTRVELEYLLEILYLDLRNVCHFCSRNGAAFTRTDDPLFNQSIRFEFE